MRLMFILAAVISGFLAISLVFFQATRKTYPGFGRWTVGVGFLTLGYLLMCLRGLIPEPVSIVLGNVAFPLGMVLHLDGIRRFLGLSAMSRWWYGLPGLDLVAVAVLYYLYDSPSWRQAVNAIAISAPHWAMAALIFRQQVKHESIFFPVIGSFIGLAGLVVLIRPVGTFFLHQWHLLMDSPFLIGTLAALIVLQLGENLSLIMLNSERVERELVEAETELRTTVNRLQEALAEQKRTEESLRQSEERYRTFFDTARDCVFITTVNGRFIDFNDAGLEMLGYSASDRQEVLTKNVASFYANPDEREAHSKRVATIGFSKDYPVDFRKKDGTIIHALVTTVARKDPQGKIIEFQGTVRDITERKKAHSALLESEEKYRNLFNNAEVGMFRTRLDGSEILEMNDKFLQIFGRTREEMHGNPSAIHWVDKDERAEMVRRLNSDGKVTEFECQMLNKRGEVRHCITSVRLYREQGILEGSIIDITDLKKAENALKESERRLRLAQDAAKAGTWEWDLRTNVNFWSDELWTLYGLEPYSCEPSYEAWLRTIHPDDREQAARTVQEASSRGLELNAVWRTNADTGESRWLMSRGRPVYDQKGLALRYTGIVIDITDRKRAEEALKASEEKYRLLVEKAREAIFVVQDTVFRYVNPAVEEILGFSADQLLGNSFVAFVHPDDRETVIERHYRRMRGETVPSRYTIRIIDGRGDVRWADIDSMMIDWEGKPAVMVFLTDITYRKLAEETAVQTERLQAVADLSAGVAHHFNNLLQILMGNISLSLLDLESRDFAQIKSTLERMLEASKLGAETVLRLQTFANIRPDIPEDEAATFDIAATARNAAEVSKPLWKAEPEKRGTQVNLQLDLEAGCLIRGKENELFEVLVNLIRNAAEAMPDGGDIALKATREADEVVITVRDTGTGVAEEHLPRVFQPFWSSKGVGIGKGMGLAVTHGLVKRHGGTISVQSRVGVGTTFTIRLPLAHEPVTKTGQRSVGRVVNRLSILVLDDELPIATLLERILARAGHRVFKALSGEEGLAIFKNEQIDLVLCDLGMPGMSGWDVGKAIRSVCREKAIPKPAFVLLTGWGGQELEKEKMAECGIDAVVGKPIDAVTLHATVQEIAQRFNVNSPAEET